VQAAAGPSLVCRPLADHARHFFTTRHWRLGGTLQSWSDVAEALELPAERLARARQVHGSAVVLARDAIEAMNRPGGMLEADIIVTDGADTSRGAAVQAADCVPLLIANRRSRAVAAAHAGWRGLAARVPQVAVAAMSREFGSTAADLVAAIGPSVGACCYEVGIDVKEAFERAGFDNRNVLRWFSREPMVSPLNPPMPGLAAGPRTDRWFFDGWSVARDQLIEAGVPAAQIFVAELCTASHPAALCSYRRDGRLAGRIAGAIRPLSAVGPVS
jgi:polyphenol oxidase